MAEYYSKEQLLESGRTTWCDMYDLEEFLDEIPAENVLQIIRCKDCKFNVANMEKDPLDITDYSGDDIVCSYFMTDGLDPNDYCSQGKRTPQNDEVRE